MLMAYKSTTATPGSNHHGMIYFIRVRVGGVKVRVRVRVCKSLC